MSGSVPSNIIEQLQRDEGLRLLAYRDTRGFLTIGYGRNLDAEGISKDEATYMLQQDIIHWGQLLTKNLPWFTALDSVRQGVLLNMCHNLGLGGLLSFKRFLLLMASGLYDAAATDLESNHKWMTQVGTRAQRLVLQIRTGEWQ